MMCRFAAILLVITTSLAIAPRAEAQSRYPTSTGTAGEDMSDFFKDMPGTASPNGGAAPNSANSRYSNGQGIAPLDTSPSAPRRSTPPNNPFAGSAPASRTGTGNTPLTQGGLSSEGRAPNTNPLRTSPGNPIDTRAPSSISRGLPPGSVANADLPRQPAIDNTREAATYAMLSKMMRAHPSSRLAGTPTALATLLVNSGDRQQQGIVTDAYWQLTASAIDYYLSLHEADEVNRLERSVPTYSTALGEVRQALQTRIETSLKSARAAQLRLEQLAPGVSRPLPQDVPFCGPYATRYEQIFTGGAPEEARLLAELLPLRLGELEESGASVAKYEAWVKQVEEASSRSRDGTGIIRSLELLALSRRAFVQLARDYNQKINRYAQLATPGEVDTGRLVAMLIRMDLPGRASGNLMTADAQGRYQDPRQAGLDFRNESSGSRR
ncbi:hypothetical protein [Botrimarina hoheduenensis]|uniref:Outer membrane efflux protein n=1 Tax=Botrimarina hoheduenensis TaxID=2528000 RepID=A0A5C5VY67_9BACT|nr:hypothetical protein [Botrimarina hoheduenensis]TWT42955.1 hypothetical protein Pla111_25930 [Botrimarina hoheduenensis]